MSNPINVNISSNNNGLNGNVNSQNPNLRSNTNSSTPNVNSNISVEVIPLSANIDTQNVLLDSGLLNENALLSADMNTFSGVHTNCVQDVLVNGESVVRNRIAYITIPGEGGVEYIYIYQPTGTLSRDDLNKIRTNESIQFVYQDHYYTLSSRQGSTRTYLTVADNGTVIRKIIVSLITGVFEYAESTIVRSHINNNEIHITQEEREFWNDKLNLEMHNEIERLEFNRN